MRWFVGPREAGGFLVCWLLAGLLAVCWLFVGWGESLRTLGITTFIGVCVLFVGLLAVFPRSDFFSVFLFAVIHYLA